MSPPSLKQLKTIHKKVIKKLTYINDVRCVFGIGSYFTKNTKSPQDLDYYIELGEAFQNVDVGQLSKIFENIKGICKNEKAEPLINILIADNNGNKLNSVDLWFIHNFPTETLDQCIEDRKNQIWINRNARLLFLKK